MSNKSPKGKPSTGTPAAELPDAHWTDPAAWLTHMGRLWPDADLNDAKARAAAAGVRLAVALARATRTPPGRRTPTAAPPRTTAAGC